MKGVLINPPARELGLRNAILNGRSAGYHVREFPGPLSIKSVVRGSALWETSEGRFEVAHADYTHRLLDDPERNSAVGFFERLHAPDAAVTPLLARMHRAVASGEATQEWLEEGRNFLDASLEAPPTGFSPRSTVRPRTATWCAGGWSAPRGCFGRPICP